MTSPSARYPERRLHIEKTANDGRWGSAAGKEVGERETYHIADLLLPIPRSSGASSVDQILGNLLTVLVTSKVKSWRRSFQSREGKKENCTPYVGFAAGKRFHTSPVRRFLPHVVISYCPFRLVDEWRFEGYSCRNRSRLGMAHEFAQPYIFERPDR